jgi:hypothetical protein
MDLGTEWCHSDDNTYNRPIGFDEKSVVWKAISIVAVVALLGLWAAVVRRQ